MKRATKPPQNCPAWQSISIHALVKRATQVLNASWDKIFISIHALVKRATKLKGCQAQAQHISIHALVKRATLL